MEDVVIEGADLEGTDLVVSVRLRRRERNRCGRCGQRSPGYDAGEGRRRWRALDLGRRGRIWKRRRHAWTAAGMAWWSAR
jgi:hypothetical protein